MAPHKGRKQGWIAVKILVKAYLGLWGTPKMDSGGPALKRKGPESAGHQLRPARTQSIINHGLGVKALKGP